LSACIPAIGCKSNAPAFECFLPPFELRSAVAYFWALRCADGGQPTVELVPPEVETDLIFFQGNSRQGIVRGPQRRLTSVTLAPATSYIGVRLRPGIAQRLIDHANNELLDRRLATAPMSAELSDILDGADGAAPNLRALDALAALLNQVLPPRMLAGEGGVAMRAVRLIAKSGGKAPISDVADRLGCSDRHLRREVMAATGLSPKECARIVRFQRAMRLLVRTDRSLAEIACDCAYVDQAHMTREFARFAGQTPTALRRTMSAFDKNGRDEAASLPQRST
jgi:AraC-like DNA-binding protein